MVKNQISIAEISVGTDIFDLYYQLTLEPAKGHQIIGKGEAASLALAYFNDGIIASNNLRDVILYVNEFNLNHITTGNILIEAYNKKCITENEGNAIWAAMLSKRRKLGAVTFTDYLNAKNI